MRKRNCKKAAAALMAAALSTALLAGCGSTAPVDSTPEGKYNPYHNRHR